MQNQMLRAITSPRMGQKAFLLVFFFALATTVPGQQASLSVQGVLTKSDGTAVDDGDYSLTFKLWTAAAGGTAVHTETLSNVETIGGVYSVVLGVNGTNITAPFDQTYYLGVSVGGGAELTPRPRLTHAPYAMALLGSSNVFPGSGTVGIGTGSPTAGNELHVKDPAAGAKVLIEGATNASIDLKKGAATATISYDGATGVALNDNLNLATGKSIAYNGTKDWRLVEIDDFSADSEGWTCATLSGTPRTFSRFTPNTFFSEGHILRPNDVSSGGVMKKQFDLTGIPHTRVKVVFTYHFLDTWSDFEYAYAAFANSASPAMGQSDGQFQVGWEKKYELSTNADFGGAGYVNFIGTPALDYNVRAEMVAQDSGNLFWLLIGSSLDQVPTDESFGISDIEIWVK